MRKTLFYLKGVLLGTLLVVFFCSCGKETVHYVTETEEMTENMQEFDTEQQTEESKETMLYIYVCGQVKHPGVYTIPAGSRIYDLFVLAGGLTESADTNYWNQARLLQDGEMIYVPSKEEVENHFGEDDFTGKTNDTEKVNINTATKAELMELPGIGEAKAMAILQYRQENGRFSSLEELMKVEGVKGAVYAKIKAYIEI